MRYLSDDGKLFDTEQQCCEHERKINEEKIKREMLEMERQNKFNSINKKYEDLQNDITEYKERYGDTGNNICSLDDFMRIVIGC